jgi:hypothetical protein
VGIIFTVPVITKADFVTCSYRLLCSLRHCAIDLAEFVAPYLSGCLRVNRMRGELPRAREGQHLSTGNGKMAGHCARVYIMFDSEKSCHVLLFAPTADVNVGCDAEDSLRESNCVSKT